MKDLEAPSINNYDGGTASFPGGDEISGGGSNFPIGPNQSPDNGATGSFKTDYKNIALISSHFKSI